MALIKCPECEIEISDKAASCPHCGFPVSSHIKSENTQNYIHFYWVGRAGDSIRKTTVCLDSQPILTMKCASKESVPVSGKSHTVDLYQGKHHLLSEQVTIEDNSDHIVFAYKETAGLTHAKLVKANVPDSEFFEDKKKKFTPKCPTCGSQNTHKISMTSKVFAFEMVGFASNSVGKTFKCKNCGYTW